MPILANKVRNGPSSADQGLSTANQKSDDTKWCYRWLKGSINTLSILSVCQGTFRHKVNYVLWNFLA